MDNRPICVFDSGVGGLTALKKLVLSLPGEEIVYFGDTGRVPYGGRSKTTILKYAAQDIRFLLSFDPKAILIACATVSSQLSSLEKPEGVPLVGVVLPSAAAACRATKNERIGVVGTKATIGSGVFEREIRGILPEAEVLSLPCPLFVPLAEEGRVKRGDTVIETVAEEYLAPFRAFGCDTLILGCTHYPLLADVISDTLPGVTLINSGAESSESLRLALAAENKLSSRSDGGRVRYFVSDDPEGFMRATALFMEKPSETLPEKIDIEKY